MTSALTSVRPSAHSVLLSTLEFFSLPSPVVDNQQRNIYRTLQSPSVSDDVEKEKLGCAMGWTIGITKMHKIVQDEL